MHTGLHQLGVRVADDAKMCGRFLVDGFVWWVAEKKGQKQELCCASSSWHHTLGGTGHLSSSASRWLHEAGEASSHP